MTTTLKSFLETEYRPEVIFGHIHRRQRELNDILGDQTERQRSYAKLQVNDILDLFLVRSFYEGLTGSRDYDSLDKYDIHCEASRNLKAAATRTDLDKADFHAQKLFGLSLSWRVKAPGYEETQRYYEIVPVLQATISQAA